MDASIIALDGTARPLHPREQRDDMRAFDDEQDMPSERIDRVLQLQNIMRARATDRMGTNRETRTTTRPFAKL